MTFIQLTNVIDGSTDRVNVDQITRYAPELRYDNPKTLGANVVGTRVYFMSQDSQIYTEMPETVDEMLSMRDAERRNYIADQLRQPSLACMLAPNA